MPAPHSSPGKRRSKSRGHSDPRMRVSDADRAEVADRLSQHYGDGRLDQAEYNERLDQAMRAKTQSDLDGLFDDLPAAETAEPSSAPPSPSSAAGAWAAAMHQDAGQRHPLHRVLFLALVVVIAVGAGHAMAHFFIPWLLIGLLAFLWLTYGPRHHDHRN